MADDVRSASSFGPNYWLVEEMYDRYRLDPASVSESWREFFEDYRGANGAPTVTVPSPAAPARPEPVAPARPEPVAPAGGEAVAMAKSAGAAEGTVSPQVLKGAALRVVANMEASLGLPTATSIRPVPAKLLEVNRTILNDHLGRTSGGKVSFTHLIAFAVVRAVASVPAMNAAFSLDPERRPAVIRHAHVNLGLAVDVENADGSRSLVVPCVRDADTLDFRAFWERYEELIRKVRTRKVVPDDLAGTTMTLTNPGTIGTEHSVPRLMPGQGVIVGVGALHLPTEYAAADPRTVAQLGISKVITLTSTYDHRIIQGAESGQFLRRIHALLIGEDGFYDEVFAATGVPYEPVRWSQDLAPIGDEHRKASKQVAVQTLINMYRVRGHLIANLDPLAAKPPLMHPELDPVTYGLSIWDLDREFSCDCLAGHEMLTLGNTLGILRDAYCRSIGVEYMHIQEPDQKRWIQEHVEGVPTALSAEEQRNILSCLGAAEAFERFLNTKFVAQKRFGLEGGESAIAIVEAVLDEAAKAGITEAVLGMGHRGRLNVLINIIGKSYGELFAEFEHIDPASTQGSGDVKYHLGFTGTFTGLSGVSLPVTLASNPSHLEAVCPVVEGMVRARQDLDQRGGEDRVLAVLLHGDAAFAGQGVVAETLNMSALHGYGTGGTVHLVINNQLGFTTNPDSARSSVYATDVAKMVQAPIFHVNGDDPEACVRVARLAFAFRQAFHKDVVIDMICYRRHGHNEGDDPSFTQPLMYERIRHHRSVRLLYTEALIKRGDLTMEEAEQAMKDFADKAQAALAETRSSAPPRPSALVVEGSSGTEPTPSTGVDQATLERIAVALHTFPDTFTVHPKLEKVFATRAKLYEDGVVDWALGEAMAYGSLLAEGVDVRLTGQDTRRGTFSHRNSTLFDYATGEEYAPLAALAASRSQAHRSGRFFCYDSLLSEYAALGFEYGYSVAASDSLVAWEAQFGDFANGGQIIVDQFLVSAEEKWGQSCGLVLLLPHGYEGQGPEHSSARLERFLQLCAGDNIRVVNATTAAQFFHVVRRQAHWSVHKPLVVMAPKSLLRSRDAFSPVGELVSGAFHEVLDDPGVPDPSAVARVMLCSGKIAYKAMQRRDAATLPVAVVRVEQLYPWPGAEITEVLAHYPNASVLAWLQEEPRNMGAWTFVAERLRQLVPEHLEIHCAARRESGSPAAGSSTYHELEEADLLQRAFAG